MTTVGVKVLKRQLRNYKTTESSYLKTNDGCGSVYDREKLEPIPLAPSFTKRIHSQDVLLGAQAKFSCKVIGEPPPTVTWCVDPSTSRLLLF